MRRQLPPPSVKRGFRESLGSPFAWILSRPSRQRGKIGEQLLAGWCAARNLNVVRSPDSDADRIIEGRRVEIKFSTLWKSGGYTFQQIRDQDYDYLICLGICPFDAHAWILRKDEIPFASLKNQHGGARGRDTWWMSFRPDSPPEYLANQTGRLAWVHETLAALRPPGSYEKSPVSSIDTGRSLR